MGKAIKKRKRETKWIQKKLKCKKMKEWPEVSNLLSELRKCYVAGANQEVYLLTTPIVERYLESLFLLEEGELLRYMTEREESISNTNGDSKVEVQQLRNEGSRAFEILKDGMVLIAVRQNEDKPKIGPKQSRALMKQLKSLMTLEESNA